MAIFNGGRTRSVYLAGFALWKVFDSGVGRPNRELESFRVLKRNLGLLIIFSESLVRAVV